jgi:hypothetical protein
VSDTHVTIAAAVHSRDTMPVIGSFDGTGVTSSLNFSVRINVQDDKLTGIDSLTETAVLEKGQ